MQVLETNTVYTIVSFVGGCRVWYAIYLTVDLSDSDTIAIFCNNDFEACYKKFTLLMEEYEQAFESDYQSEKNAEMANEISLYGCRL